jgi:acetoin utilization deacetylase AcuC-like enzyme
MIRCAAGADTMKAAPYLHTGLVADPICKLHEPGWGHPECPERYDAIFDALCRTGLIDHLRKIPCRPASEDELALCHTRDYIQLVQREVEAGGHTLSTGDADICPKSYEAALYSAGGVLAAVDSVVERQTKNAFCVVRPPGHHATADKGMGFCLFNNIAIAARYAQKKHGLERVLIVDWDVHHGNGTQDVFYEDGSVFYFSTHQSPLYPGTGLSVELGRGAGRGTTLNCPVAAGAGREDILGAFERELLPAMERFKPGIVLISAGFDSRVGDPLGSLMLTDHDFADLTSLMLDVAKKYAGGRLVSVLEGGYNLDGIASAAVAHVRTLAGALV